MSHLHIPDGVLPPVLWGSAWAAALIVLALSAVATRAASAQQIAYRGSLGALALAAMALAIPIGPVEYHLNLLGPVGVLLGVAGSYEVLFVVAAILAFAGHGGLTVVGLNALLLGSGAAVARPVYRLVARRASPAAAMAVAAAASQALSGALWVLVMRFALGGRLGPAGRASLPWVGAAAAAIWLGGVIVETLVALGVGRFLVRVKPELLPGAPGVAAAAAGTGRE